MTKIVIQEITDENRDELFIIALSMYLGECCKYCGKQAKTLDDLRTVVYAGSHAKGRIACESCWNANNPSEAK
jgi:predicted RNA-binding protein YlqC (UPF0109 family)